MTYEVTLLDHPAPVAISSLVVNRQETRPPDELPEHRPSDPRLATVLPQRVLNARAKDLTAQRIMLGYQTTNSRMTLAVGVDHVIDTGSPHETVGSVDDDTGELLITADAQVCVPIRITKYATYQSSRTIPVPELVDRCMRTLDRTVRDGFDELLVKQREQLDQFWDRADVRVESDFNPVRLQQAIRWNLYQVAQASWRAEGAGIPAKGLTGQGYEGHYFWDSEIYLLPFLSYTQPRIARNVLRFRHSMLGRARERAREMSQKGALFPWRTINGEEASANFQAGTAQYHINADIAYAIMRYSDVRGGLGLLSEVGAEILVETARLWEDLGFYGTDGRFHFHGVTGPDEYTTVVNDNAYTNLMARLNLSSAAATVRRLREERPAAYTALVHDVALDADEVESWERAAAAMYVPYDDKRGIHPQDTTFLEREVWDLAGTPREKFPLLLHYHPLVIYRHQVIKQADIVLAMFLLGNEFSEEQKRRNFDYYDALTTGVCPEHPRRRDRQRTPSHRVLQLRATHGSGQHRRQRLEWSPHRIGRRRLVVARIRFWRRPRLRGAAVVLTEPATRLGQTRILAAVPRPADPSAPDTRRGALPRRRRRAVGGHHPGRAAHAQPRNGRRHQAFTPQELSSAASSQTQVRVTGDQDGDLRASFAGARPRQARVSTAV
jgi:alpha,alpha-trehalose phosphorylase